MQYDGSLTGSRQERAEPPNPALQLTLLRWRCATQLNATVISAIHLPKEISHNE